MTGQTAVCARCGQPIERCHEGCTWRHRSPDGRLEESCGLFAIPLASTVKPRTETP